MKTSRRASRGRRADVPALALERSPGGSSPEGSRGNVGSILIIAALLAACGGGDDRDDAIDLFQAFETARAGEPIQASTRLGPAVATVRLSPGKPRLGDVLYLELSVTAPAGVDVVMPAFGEALGRFSIDDFDRRSGPVPETGQASPEGAREAGRSGATMIKTSHLYQLQAQTSGRVRIPSLRVEVADRRPGAEAEAREVRELLTDELPVDIAPITDAPKDLVAGPGRIDVPDPPLVTRWWMWALAAAVIGAAVAFLLWRRKRAGVVARASAYDRAVDQLEQLEAAGLPAGDEIDAWYVHLSSIVRRYLEERFAIRAPELTTEEFLREASASLSTEHRRLLGDFLAGCDRVKFAQHTPSAEEMRGALDTALAFVRQTRPEESAAEEAA